MGASPGDGARSGRGRSTTPPATGGPTERLVWGAAAVGLERWARLGSVAVVPLLVAESDRGQLLPIFAALAGYVLLTALAPRNAFLRATDLLAAAAVTAVSAGNVAPFLPFLVVSVAAPAAQGGARDGVVVGATLSGALLLTLAATDQLGPGTGLPTALLAVPLLPLAGLASALATRVVQAQARRERLVLEEANRLLSSLRAIAGELPGGLDTTTVAAAVLAEVRALPEARAVLVLVDEDGVLVPAASSGLAVTAPPSLRVDEVRRLAPPGTSATLFAPEQLPTTLQRATAAHPCWSASAVRRDAELIGIVLVGGHSPDAANALAPRLRSIADDAALALDNARLFDGTRIRAADAARRRIAGDLHDGVAQSLAHLRLELELLAGSSPSDGHADLRRLAEVAASALEDLRRTIGGLRQPMASDLAAQLERHVAQLARDGGPVINLEVLGSVRLDPDRTSEVLRIAQEALSNALRHARATEITVWLEGDEDEINLTIEDDGVGLPPATPTDTQRTRTIASARRRPAPAMSNGVGVTSMTDRAARLDGSIKLRDRRGGGTVVHLRLPVGRRPRGGPG